MADRSGIELRVTVDAIDRTGPEMEAMLLGKSGDFVRKG